MPIFSITGCVGIVATASACPEAAGYERQQMVVKESGPWAWPQADCGAQHAPISRASA